MGRIIEIAGYLPESVTERTERKGDGNPISLYRRPEDAAQIIHEEMGYIAASLDRETFRNRRKAGI